MREGEEDREEKSGREECGREPTAPEPWPVLLRATTRLAESGSGGRRRRLRACVMCCVRAW